MKYAKIKVITTARVFCVSFIRLSKSIRIADRVTYNLTPFEGTRVSRVGVIHAKKTNHANHGLIFLQVHARVGTGQV